MDKKSNKRPSEMEDQSPPKRTRFTIESLIGLQSIFSIANLLGLNSSSNSTNPSTSQQQQIGEGTSKKPEDYVQRLETTIDENRKFKFIKSRSKFMIKDLPRDPEGLLSGWLLSLFSIKTIIYIYI